MDIKLSLKEIPKCTRVHGAPLRHLTVLHWPQSVTDGRRMGGDGVWTVDGFERAGGCGGGGRPASPSPPVSSGRTHLRRPWNPSSGTTPMGDRVRPNRR
ncbi:hypothetical protein ACLOJK_009579 [Asimina triloba]